MASWINLSEEGEPNMVVMHQPDLHSSNATLVLACLIAFMHRETFVEGATEVLPFVQELAQFYTYTDMSWS